MSDYLTRYDAAQPHRDKGFRWGNIGMFTGVPLVAQLPIQIAVEDAAWSIAMAALTLPLLALQITALVKSVRAHRRANKILAGAR